MAKPPTNPRSDRDHSGGDRRVPFERPTLRVMPTTLWEYPSMHYNPGGVRGRPSAMQGDKTYAGATPSWVIWQLLMRYTREGDTIVDPMCGSGTTIDVCTDLKRRPIGLDLAPSRPDIRQADSRTLPLEKESADFVFIDPPYSTHIEYSGDPKCIGKLDAADPASGYYPAMERVIAEIHRVLKPRRYMGLYVSDSFRKRASAPGERAPKGEGGAVFMPIGFELFARLREKFKPVDIISVVRHNQKIDRGNWRKAAEEGNFFLRGFNYLFIMKKE